MEGDDRVSGCDRARILDGSRGAPANGDAFGDTVANAVFAKPIADGAGGRGQFKRQGGLRSAGDFLKG